MCLPITCCKTRMRNTTRLLGKGCLATRDFFVHMYCNILAAIYCIGLSNNGWSYQCIVLVSPIIPIHCIDLLRWQNSNTLIKNVKMCITVVAMMWLDSGVPGAPGTNYLLQVLQVHAIYCQDAYSYYTDNTNLRIVCYRLVHYSKHFALVCSTNVMTPVSRVTLFISSPISCYT
jgi:hypothetical protein